MSLSKFSLEGKKALVVGARRNMGKAFALGLAEAGADVAVTDINIESGQLLKVSKEIEAMDRKSLALKADISSEKEVKKLVKTVVDEFGTIDILMNVFTNFFTSFSDDISAFNASDLRPIASISLLTLCN